MEKLRPSLEICVDRVGDEVRLSARSSREEKIPTRSLGLDVPWLLGFSADVRRVAASGRALDDKLIADAQTLQKSILADDVGALLARLQEAANGAILVRLSVQDSELQSVPWEASCNSREALGFWATSAQVFPARSVTSNSPWSPREIRGPVRVLAIAPTGSADLPNLKLALSQGISSGEIEWLDPLDGQAAKVQNVLDRFRREPIPNIVHFLGHGAIDKNGRPALRMSDDGDEESWLPAETLAQQMASSFRGMLRLVVLEACEGAKPSAFDSAAEILARAGADAVVAFAWPVRADVAQTCSTEFYRAMTRSDYRTGDVAFAINEARRVVIAAHDASAEALGPILYLRGPDGTIFDFKGRKVSPPKPPPMVQVAAVEAPKSLVRLTRGKFSLVLGDRWKTEDAAIAKFREKLEQELAKAPKMHAGLPMSTLAQWFALRKGSDKLSKEFQRSFGDAMDAPPTMKGLAKFLGPGVHTTLLRYPWLEQSLAEANPDKHIYVIQSEDSGAMVLRRAAGADDWEDLGEPPSDIDMDVDFLILRPYRGYTPDRVFSPPLLTEDDYDLRLRDIWSTKVLPVDLRNAVQRALWYRPALFLGLSVLTGHHRVLLRNLYSRGVPRESLAIVDREDQERTLWESGTGLPGRDDGVEVLEISITDFATIFDDVPEGTDA